MRTERPEQPPEGGQQTMRAGLEALAARHAQQSDDGFPPPDSELAIGHADVLRDALRSLVMRRQASGDEGGESKQRPR